MFCNQNFNVNDDMKNMSNDMMQDNQNIDLQGVCCPSVMECPKERCCKREIHHCVEHIVPINTKIINHHIYHHVYKPVYTCCEENVCSQECSYM